MKLTKICGICVVMIGMLVLSPLRAQDTQAPDVMVKNLVEQTIKALKEDPALTGDPKLDANKKAVADYVRNNINPYIDLREPTSSPLDESQSANERMRALMSILITAKMPQEIFGMLATCKKYDCVIQFLPLRAQPSDTKAVVQTTMQPPGNAKVNLDYSLVKTDTGWKIYDVILNGDSLKAGAVR